MNSFEGSFGPSESGILVPLKAVHGEHDHQGTLGPESRDILAYLNQAGFGIWQDLPLSPPDPFESPYSSDSAFAIDPQRIDLFQLAEYGDIDRCDLDQYQKLAQSGDAGPEMRSIKRAMLKKAFRRFSQTGSPERKESFARWCHEESAWLDNYAAFEILKTLPQNSDWRWQKWETGKDCGDRLIEDIKAYREVEFSTLCYEQWVAEEQTLRLLADAESLGIEVWGDVPFYVGGGEVWAHRDLFNLDENGNQLNQGGAAPSLTSATGQMWGFPTYKVDGLENPGQTAKVVEWWQRRLARSRKLNNGSTRLDHFIGLAEPWIIAADAVDGTGGIRDVGIGDALLARERERYGEKLRLYPEDLGTQTAVTGELRDKYGLPCNTIAVRGLTKCLLLGEYRNSRHSAENQLENSVYYSSNHDMMTLIGVFNSIRTENADCFAEYIDYVNEMNPLRKITIETSTEQIAAIEMERIVRSKGRVVIMAAWDMLGLGAEGRYNVPNTISPNNWSWRMNSDHMSKLKSEVPYWRELNISSGRTYQATIAAAAD